MEMALRDLTLAKRISLFQNQSSADQINRVFNVAARYVYEIAGAGDWNGTKRSGRRSSYGGKHLYQPLGDIRVWQLPTSDNLNLNFG